MSRISSFFVTRIYQSPLKEFGDVISLDEIENTCYVVAEDDIAGQHWCQEEGYPGYTSYSSIDDLAWRIPIFKELIEILNKHVEVFVEDLEFDLNGKSIELENIWINILPEGGMHSSHIHPNNVISGTTYIRLSEGARSIKFEDPRHAMMMACPNRKPNAKPALKSFVYFKPEIGDVLLWESWLRHEVPMNTSSEDRISISFNYTLV